MKIQACREWWWAVVGHVPRGRFPLAPGYGAGVFLHRPRQSPLWISASDGSVFFTNMLFISENKTKLGDKKRSHSRSKMRFW